MPGTIRALWPGCGIIKLELLNGGTIGSLQGKPLAIVIQATGKRPHHLVHLVGILGLKISLIFYQENSLTGLNHPQFRLGTFRELKVDAIQKSNSSEVNRKAAHIHQLNKLLLRFIVRRVVMQFTDDQILLTGRLRSDIKGRT